MPRLSLFVRPLLLAASLLALAACNEQAYQDFSAKHDKQLTPKILAAMKAKGMDRGSPIMARIFKEEGVVEIWKQKTTGRYDVIASYNICKWSGKLGPKFIEGDRQAPEGFYTVRPGQMKPNSDYYLAFNIGFPNAFDRANGRSGTNLMVHGACSSSGCYSMTDPQMEEIYAFGREAFQGGQTEFQIQAFPFRMTAANMARYRDDPNYAFWKNLKEGYDDFEISRVPPKVDVCEKRYVFNAETEAGTAFSPAAACPSFTRPEALKVAYQSYQSRYDAAFSSAVGSGSAPAPRASIAGIKEAKLVADWSKKRASGERITLEPPTLGKDGSVVQTTTRMGRVDSPAGRRLAERDAAEQAKKDAAEAKAAAVRRAEQERAAAEAAAAAAAAAPPPVAAEADPPPAEQPGLLSRMGKKITGMFGS